MPLAILMASDEKSNWQVCEEFRALLTTGFYAAPGVEPDAALALTKPWRSDLWKAFAELEERLCPVQARERKIKMRKEREAAAPNGNARVDSGATHASE